MTDIPYDRSFWKNTLKRVAHRTRNAAEAEDLLHSAFLRMARYCRNHSVDNPGAFLVRTAANIRIDNYRHERMVADCIAGGVLETQNNVALQDELIEVRARLSRVEEGLAQLPPRTREVFLMHRVEGLKYREIATRIGVSQSSVEKHVARAGLFLAEWTKGW
jgi:RNA polymerase sigma factor (sigma-70 family)